MAIKNNQNCRELTTSPVFGNRWATGAIYYSDLELESTAWNVIDQIIMVHEHGWTAKINDKNLRDSIQQTMFFTFEDRLNGLLELLTVSSFTSHMIVQAPY